jgi:hypothetical protein
MKYKAMLEAEPRTLREHYRGCRELAYNNGRMAQHTTPQSRTRRKLANSMGYLMRQISMMENVAKVRGLSLV